MDRNDPPPAPPGALAPRVEAGAVLRPRAAELAPFRGHRVALMSGMMATMAATGAACIALASPVPMALVGPMMAASFWFLRRLERRAGVRAFEKVPVTPDVRLLAAGARARVAGTVMRGDGDADRGDAPVMVLTPAPDTSAATLRLTGHDFLLRTDGGELLLIEVARAWLLPWHAGEGGVVDVAPVAVAPGERVEVVGFVGDAVHPAGMRATPRAAPTVPSLRSGRTAALIVRKCP